MPATTPRSCVIMISAVSRSATSACSSSRICAWIVTSSAVVGSSAISSFGSHGERHRDHRALPHAAGELVRIVLAGAASRSGSRPGRAARPRAVSACALSIAEVRLERLADLPADRQHRVQRGHRVLEDHRDLAAADRAQLLVRQREQVAAAEHRRALRDAAVARQDPEQRERGDALAAARLADDAERLAGRDVEGDPVDGVDEPALRPEPDVQVVDA